MRSAQRLSDLHPVNPKAGAPFLGRLAYGAFGTFLKAGVENCGIAASQLCLAPPPSSRGIVVQVAASDRVFHYARAPVERCHGLKK
jgi:hypothetical protein